MKEKFSWNSIDFKGQNEVRLYDLLLSEPSLLQCGAALPVADTFLIDELPDTLSPKVQGYVGENQSCHQRNWQTGCHYKSSLQVGGPGGV